MHDAAADLLGAQAVLDQVAHEMVGRALERAAEALRPAARGEMDAGIDRCGAQDRDADIRARQFVVERFGQRDDGIFRHRIGAGPVVRD